MAGNDDNVDVVIFLGSGGPTPPEQLVARGREAVAHDLVELVVACPLAGRVVVATSSPSFADRLASDSRVVVDRDDPERPFHFGQRLVELVELYGMRRPLYFGGAAAPLLSAARFHELCARLLSVERTVIANNARSADFFGFTPPAALRRVDLPGQLDNSVPLLLSHQGGLQVEALAPSIENTFDIDTPTDLAVLKAHAGARAHGRAYLDQTQLHTERLEAVMPLLVDLNAQLTLIGRVNTGIWGQSTSDIPGARRLYVEERGMQAAGRDVRGEVRSLVGHLLEAVGPERLFAQLASYSDAVFFDTRVVFHHLHLTLSAADRFASDLGDLEAITNPIARAFTAAALACEKPVVFGGRGIVSGTLWALTQAAWDRADASLLDSSALD